MSVANTEQYEQYKQMEMFLAKWQPYIEVDDFESLTELVTNTINGVKMQKMYVLYDKDDEAESYFRKDLKKFIQISYMPSQQCETQLFTHTSSQLCVVTHLEDVTNYESIKKLLSDDYIMIKKLYQSEEQVKSTCNVLGITNKMPFTNDEKITQQIKVIRIKTNKIYDNLIIKELSEKISRSEMGGLLKELLSTDPIMSREPLEEVKYLSDSDRLNLIRKELSEKIPRSEMGGALKELLSTDPIMIREQLEDVKYLSDSDRLNRIRSLFNN
jgi:hypothetical protein